MTKLALALLPCFVLAAAAHAAPAQRDEPAVPGDFSINNQVPGKLSYRTSPKLLPIYVYDDDRPGQSNCNIGCIGPWTPVVASGSAKPFGDWTIIQREDRRPQWAFKGHPLYTHFNDYPGQPSGDGDEGKWHLFQP